MWGEFKKFAMRGNVIDLAVGIIVGAAFGRIVTDLVQNVIMPPFGLILNHVDFKDLYVSLDGVNHGSLSQAQAAGAPVIAYGIVVNDLIDFIIVAFVIFLMIKWINRLQSPPTKEQDKPTDKQCPYCKLMILIEATRCPQCTSYLDGREEKLRQKPAADVRVPSA
jgi:large conductance mechanosensitive channel